MAAGYSAEQLMCHALSAFSGLFLLKLAAARRLLNLDAGISARGVGDYSRPAVFSNPNFSMRYRIWSRLSPRSIAALV